ncbi:MAG: hypothetical protein M1828_002929 [Chrysothrix sp. TS-e1954]|nr:MAG: hypothetical protein M1828_002929 [Chrysothrix sp. TS-e1954]
MKATSLAAAVIGLASIACAYFDVHSSHENHDDLEVRTLSTLKTSAVSSVASHTASPSFSQPPAAGLPDDAPAEHAPPTMSMNLPSTTPAVPSSAASPTRAYVHFDCGTNITHASEHFLSTVHSLHVGSLLESSAQPAHGPLAARWAKKSGTSSGTSAAAAAPASPATASGINVDLYMHVVTTAANAGMITAAQLTKQLHEMNTAYAAHGIQFTLQGKTFTTNDTWAIGASDADDTSMKTALRKGSYSALNLYFQSDLAGGMLGRCTLPTNIGSNPTPISYVADGCNIAAGTVPGGPIYGYNQGKTAVHETGHWLGLLHTFEGYSCSGSGDYVADTPMESISTDGCPMKPWKNSCAGMRPGDDPIHNYMDYSIDSCYTKFTPGQQSRMQQLWPQYRQGK